MHNYTILHVFNATMLCYTFATLQYRLFCATPQIQQTHEYNDQVGLLIQNRMTDRYAPEFMIDCHVHKVRIKLVIIIPLVTCITEEGKIISTTNVKTLITMHINFVKITAMPLCVS